MASIQLKKKILDPRIWFSQQHTRLAKGKNKRRLGALGAIVYCDNIPFIVPFVDMSSSFILLPLAHTLFMVVSLCATFDIFSYTLVAVAATQCVRQNKLEHKNTQTGHQRDEPTLLYIDHYRSYKLLRADLTDNAPTQSPDPVQTLAQGFPSHLNASPTDVWNRLMLCVGFIRGFISRGDVVPNCVDVVNAKTLI